MIAGGESSVSRCATSRLRPTTAIGVRNSKPSPATACAIQQERVVLAYQYLWECSPFYRAKFERAGLAADSVRSLSDLAKIPVTRREEWLENQEANPPWGTFSPLRQEDWTERGWMLFTTSGTTAAQPARFRHTTHDRDLWSWLGARALICHGYPPRRYRD